ncbi:MAG: kinase [Gammaproteobacteria bacterium]|nr:kinase [Gammaproteobacteria bacterium]
MLAPETAAAEGRVLAEAPELAHLPPARRLELGVHAAQLAAWIDQRVPESGHCRVIGLNGGQGSGKTTLAQRTAAGLERRGLRTLVLSLDDLYLGREARRALADSVHPLLATRGVPGTHDVRIGRTLLDALRAGASGLPLPRFDKARDDRLPRSRWPRLEAGVDVVLFEGWCVGATPEPEAALVKPVNELERDEDPDALWRRFVNRALADECADLFAGLDALVMLRVPDFEAVRRWREEQEAVLRRERGAERGPERGPAGMSPAEVIRFVAHYERLTRHMLRTLPERADLILELDRDHAVAGVTPRR